MLDVADNRCPIKTSLFPLRLFLPICWPWGQGVEFQLLIIRVPITSLKEKGQNSEETEIHS